MSPSKQPKTVKQTADRRQTSRPVLLGKLMPSLPVLGKRRSSDVLIWVLAICIAIALILRATLEAPLLSLATDSNEAATLFRDLEERLNSNSYLPVSKHLRPSDAA